MRTTRRISIYLCMTLVAASSSVFFIPQNASAQSLNDTVVNPLREKEPLVKQQKQKIAQKSSELQMTQQELQDIETKKQELATQLEQAKSEIDELNQKLADKKARVEAEKKRVEELKNMFVNVTAYAGNSAGNLYAPGYCTWYVKNRRADLPNNLGNANAWYANAAAQGFKVGSTPKKGAVAATTAGGYGHVAYVEGVTPDGQYVTISEMNYGGLYRMNTRTVHYTEFNYIYEL